MISVDDVHLPISADRMWKQYVSRRLPVRFNGIDASLCDLPGRWSNAYLKQHAVCFPLPLYAGHV